MLRPIESNWQHGLPVLDEKISLLLQSPLFLWTFAPVNVKGNKSIQQYVDFKWETEGYTKKKKKVGRGEAESQTQMYEGL